MVNHFLEMWRYDLWANTRTIASIRALPIPPERIIKLMSHIIAAQQIWYERVTGGNPGKFNVWGIIHIEDMQTAAEEINAKWSTLLAQTTEADLQKTFTYTNTVGNTYTNTLYEMLTHIPNHSTYHRAQIASDVRTAAGKPAVTDYIQYAREEH